MTLFEAEKILKTEKLQFGSDRQIEAVRTLELAEELKDLVEKYDLECPTCEGSATVKCPECDGTGEVECDDCDGGTLDSPSKFTDAYAIQEILVKARRLINEAKPTVWYPLDNRQENLPISA